METVPSFIEGIWIEMVRHFDIPDMRKEFNLSNVEWFLRNAAIRNNENPRLSDAFTVARAARWWLRK